MLCPLLYGFVRKSFREFSHFVFLGIARQCLKLMCHQCIQHELVNYARDLLLSPLTKSHLRFAGKIDVHVYTC